MFTIDRPHQASPDREHGLKLVYPKNNLAKTIYFDMIFIYILYNILLHLNLQKKKVY